MIGAYGIELGLIIYMMGIIGFVLNTGKNIIMYIISIEILLLGIGITIMNSTFQQDDLIGANITLQIQPMAGAETAVSLAYIVAFSPQRGTIIVK